MQTIHETILATCKSTPRRPALRHKIGQRWQSVSYEKLGNDVCNVAYGLLHYGLKPGEHVALVGASSPRWVTSYLGILQAGGVVIPIDKELKAQEIRHIMADSQACIAFVGNEHRETVQEIASTLPTLRKVVLLDDLVLPVDGDVPPSNLASALWFEWESLAAEVSLPADKTARLRELSQRLMKSLGNDGKEKKNKLIQHYNEINTSPLPLPKRTQNDIAAIIYTSGTTGRSKGAMLSHANIVTNIQNGVAHFGVNDTIHTLSFLPINHIFEQVVGILLPLSLGGTITFAESLKKLGENLVEVKPTFFLAVPAVYRIFHDRLMKTVDANPVSRLLLNIPLARNIVTSKVRSNFGGGTTFLSGGAALDPMVANGLEALGLSIYQGYGITETSPIISAEAPGRKKVGSVGRPIPGVELRIESPNAEGVGELSVKGPNVMVGYYNNAVATDEVLRNGWYRTGDLARIDEDGYVWLCGRVKNLIVTSNGRNVYPEEIENALLQSPFIAEVMVYGHKIDQSVEEVHAIIVPNQSALDEHAAEAKKSLQEKDVENLIRSEVNTICGKLADYKRVKKFTLREDELPKTTTRKIKRFEVEANIQARD